MSRQARAEALASLRGLLEQDPPAEVGAYVAPLEAALQALPKLPGYLGARNFVRGAIGKCKANDPDAIDGRYGVRHAVSELARRTHT